MSLPPYDSPLPPHVDEIPHYSASLEYYGLALLKIEFDTPWSCRSGPMRPVIAELNSNQLRLYDLAADKSVVSVVEALFAYQNYEDGSTQQNNKYGGAGAAAAQEAYLFDGDAYGDDVHSGLTPTVLSKLRTHYTNKKIEKKLKAKLPAELLNNTLLLEPTADAATYRRFAARYRGKLIHCLTLQNLEVGEAPLINLQNYKEDNVSNCHSIALLRYRNTLRLRIEHFQLLLHFWSFNGMVHWFRNLCIGRDLASSLDTRAVAKLKLIPRNFSSRNNALLEASAQEAARLHYSTYKSRNSVGSIDSFADGYSDSTSVGTSMDSLLTGRTSIESGHALQKTTTQVFGDTVVCYENFYTPAEKQYISNCILTLNSFDKWAGAAMTLSNYTRLLPSNDDNNINDNGKIFISLNTFNSLVKSHVKDFQKLLGTMTNECRTFHVDNTGLVSLDQE